MTAKTAVDERDDLIREFLIESHENLDRLDVDLVELEKDPRDRERLASIFRTIHTIKGTCGFLAFTKLEALSHTGESLLSRMRDLTIVLNADIATALLAMVDAIRRILASIETSGTEGEEDFSALVAELTRLNEGSSPAAPAAAPMPIQVQVQVQVPVADEPADDRRPAVSDSSLRVDVGLLEKLMNLVGELVLARNQILQFGAAHGDAAFTNATGRLNLVTSELQEGVMKTRMQPIGNIWSKFPRIVRDVAAVCNKSVRLEMDGKETELDKTIIEAIKDPLTHIVRNSVDHGIEPAAARVACGKPAEGCIRLRAYHEGGQINIEISDDGAGLDLARVRAKALQRGLVTAEQIAAMGDAEITRLIFLPGFSTAEAVTNVSGRGVGMDVVKTNIEKIGGQVDVQSVAGKGTTLKIKIPLTLAIIPALMVAAGGDRYAIPQVNLLELVRLEGTEARDAIEWIQDAPFHRLRGNLLPLVHLHRELGVDRVAGDDIIYIVVLKADAQQFGLVVDEIHDTEEIVVKPLGQQLKGLTVFAGATIMGDGRVALILDVLGTAQRAHVIRDAAGDHSRTVAVPSRAEQIDDAETLLLFLVAGTERMAMPLDLVARLEEFPAARIERSGRQEVVQYRQAIMPLVSLSQFFSDAPPPPADPRQVIVFGNGGRSVGLVVDRILDIVHERAVVQRPSTRAGILGSSVIQDRVTDLVDVHAVMRAADPSFVDAASTSRG